MFKNYAPFTDSIIEMNKTQVDNAKDLDVVSTCMVYNSFINCTSCFSNVIIYTILENCVDDYIGETARTVNERIVDHTGRDTNSCLLKHSIESAHKP